MRQSGRTVWPNMRRLMAASVSACCCVLFTSSFAQTVAKPRFASLKADRVVVRQAPGPDAPVLWTFHRLGWPVEVLRESGAFAEVRDNDGAIGWVSSVHLSGRRTAIIVGASTAASPVVLRADGRESARPSAELEPGLQAVVVGCDGRWCRLMIGDVKGWLEQNRLWGVYIGERID